MATPKEIIDHSKDSSKEGRQEEGRKEGIGIDGLREGCMEGGGGGGDENYLEGHEVFSLLFRDWSLITLFIGWKLFAPPPPLSVWLKTSSYCIKTTPKRFVLRLQHG